MKRIVFAIIALIMAAGCGEKPGSDKPVDPINPPEEKDKLAEKITGEWHCVVSGIDADIRLALMSDKTFELYQKVGEGAHRLYRGSWSMNEHTKILSGRYNDGTEWGSSYETSISDDKNSMTLTAKASATREEYVYRREAIPDEVKEGSITVVKSEGFLPVL